MSNYVSGKIKLISFDEIVDMSMEDISRIVKVTKEDINGVWIAFKNFVQDRLDQSQNVDVFKIFTIAKNEKTKVLSLIFNKKWMLAKKKKQNLTNDDEDFTLTVGLNFTLVEKFFGGNKSLVALTLKTILLNIERTIVNSSNSIELELRHFGSVYCFDSTINFLPIESNLSSKTERLPQIKHLLKRQQGVSNVENLKMSNLVLTSSSVQPVRSVKLHKINQLITQDLSNFKETHLNFRNPEEEKLERQIESSQKMQLSYKETIKGNYRIRNQQLPSGPYKEYEEFDVSSQLGAKKIESKTAKQILLEPMQLNPLNSKKLPRILEEHNQTKASAITSVYNSLSPSARIGSNHTSLSQFIHLDANHRKVTVLYCGETKKRVNTVASIGPTSGDVLNDDQTHLYDQYINEVVQNFEVVNIPKSMIDKIKNKIRTNFKYFSKDKENCLFENLISEIKIDFEKSLKRIILDYLMLNFDERKRLGFRDYTLNSHQSPKIFEPSSLGIPLTTNKGLKSMLDGNLLLYSKTTNVIINCWKQLEDSYLCDVSQSGERVSINQFVENQRVVMSQVHNTITVSWIKQVSEIYKNHTSKLPKKSVKIFFRTMGRVLSDQIRTLIVRSVLKFRSFIKEFDQGEFLSTTDSIKSFFDSESVVSSSYLVLKVQEEDRHLRVEVDVESATRDISECILEIIKTSENIARPENFFYRLEKSSLDSVSLNEKFVEEAKELVESIVRKAFGSLSDFRNYFDTRLMLLSEKESLLSKIESRIGAEELSKLFLSYKNMESDLVFWFPSEIPMNLFSLDLCEIKETLISNTKNLRVIISEYVIRNISTLSAFIIKSLKSAFDEICVRIESVEKLIEAEKWIFKFLGEEFLQLEDNYSEMVVWLETMMPYLQFEVDTYRQVVETRQCLCDYSDKISKERERVAMEREAFERRLASKRGVVNQKGNDLYVKIENLQKEGRLFWMDRIMVDIQETTQLTQDTIQEIGMINHEEMLLGHDKSDFPIIEQSQKALKILELFWTSIHDWTLESKKCESVVIFKIEVDKIDQKVESFEKYIREALTEFRLQPHLTADPVSLGEKILAEISNFKSEFELVRYLVFEGLRPRHWLYFNKILNEERMEVKLETNGVYYLSTLRDMNLKFVEQQLKEVYTSAKNEFRSEQKVIEIEEYVNNTIFNLKLYRESSEMLVLDLTATGNLVIELESYMEDVRNMKYAAEALFFKERVFDLSKRIEFGLEVVDIWVRLQKEWIRKEQVFRLEDITRTLPSESMIFKEAYVDFRTFVNHRKRDPSFRHICKDKLLKISLSKILDNLSHLDHKISSYVSTKLSLCPRLSLLSPRSLEEFIACGNNLTLVNKFIPELFTSISELIIEDSCLIAIQSKGDSLLKLKEVVDVFNFKGSGPQWILKVEETIKREVKRVIVEALQDYGLKSKITFILNKTPQSCALAYQIASTFETENALNIGGTSLDESLAEIDSSIQEMGDNMDTVSSRDMPSFEVLLLAILRSRDVVTNLIQMQIDKSDDFEWHVQQKYYWEQAGSIESDNAKVQVFGTTKLYGYEFLDISSLHIGSQQSARYSIVSALTLKENKGLVLLGKEGMGKRTFFRELASSFGFAPIVFNLKESDNQSDVGRILVGGVGSQAWMMFSNIEMLSESMISFLAQNLLNMQDAVLKQKSEVVINGITLKLPKSIFHFGCANTDDFPCRSSNVGKTFRRVVFNEPDIDKQLSLVLQAKGFSNYGVLSGSMQELRKRGRVAFRNYNKMFLSLSDLSTIISLIVQQRRGEGRGTLHDEELFGQSIMIFYSGSYSTHDLNILKYLIKESFYVDLNNFESIDSLYQMSKIKEVTGNEQRQGDSSEVESPELNLSIRCLKMLARTFRVIVIRGDQGSGKSHLLSKVFDRQSNHNYFEELDLGFFDEDQLNLSLDLSETSVIRNSICSACFSRPETEFQSRVLTLHGRVSPRLLDYLIAILEDCSRVVIYNERLMRIPLNFYIVIETSDISSYSSKQMSRIGVLNVGFETPSRIRRCVNWLSFKNIFPVNSTEQLLSFFESIAEPILDAWSKLQSSSSISSDLIMSQVLKYSDNELKALQENGCNLMDGTEKAEFVDQMLLSNLCLILGSLTQISHHKLLEMIIKKACQSPDKSLTPQAVKNYRRVNIPEEGSVLQMYFTQAVDSKKNSKMLRGVWNSLETVSIERLAESDNDEFKTIKSVEQARSLLLMEKALAHDGRSLLITGVDDSGKSFLVSKLAEVFQKQGNKAVLHSVNPSSRAIDIVDLLNVHLVYNSKTGVFEPKSKNTKLVLLLDDFDGDIGVGGQRRINEVVYSILRHKCYFNIRSENMERRRIENVQIVATMNSENISRINTRLFEQVSWIHMNQLDDPLLLSVLLSQITKYSFEEETFDVIKRLPLVTIELFQEIRRRIDCSFAFHDKILSFKTMSKLLRLLIELVIRKVKKINVVVEYVALIVREVVLMLINPKEQEILMHECLKPTLLRLMNVTLESVLSSDSLQIPSIPFISDTETQFVGTVEASQKLHYLFKETSIDALRQSDLNYILTNYIMSSALESTSDWLLLRYSTNDDYLQELLTLNLKSRSFVVHRPDVGFLVDSTSVCKYVKSRILDLNSDAEHLIVIDQDVLHANKTLLDTFAVVFRNPMSSFTVDETILMQLTEDGSSVSEQMIRERVSEKLQKIKLLVFINDEELFRYIVSISSKFLSTTRCIFLSNEDKQMENLRRQKILASVLESTKGFEEAKQFGNPSYYNLVEIHNQVIDIARKSPLFDAERSDLLINKFLKTFQVSMVSFSERLLSLKVRYASLVDKIDLVMKNDTVPTDNRLKSIDLLNDVRVYLEMFTKERINEAIENVKAEVVAPESLNVLKRFVELRLDTPISKSEVNEVIAESLSIDKLKDFPEFIKSSKDIAEKLNSGFLNQVNKDDLDDFASLTFKLLLTVSEWSRYNEVIAEEDEQVRTMLEEIHGELVSFRDEWSMQDPSINFVKLKSRFLSEVLIRAVCLTYFDILEESLREEIVQKLKFLISETNFERTDWIVNQEIHNSYTHIKYKSPLLLENIEIMKNSIGKNIFAIVDPDLYFFSYFTKNEFFSGSVWCPSFVSELSVESNREKLSEVKYVVLLQDKAIDPQETDALVTAALLSGHGVQFLVCYISMDHLLLQKTASQTFYRKLQVVNGEICLESLYEISRNMLIGQSGQRSKEGSWEVQSHLLQIRDEELKSKIDPILESLTSKSLSVDLTKKVSLINQLTETMEKMAMLNSHKKTLVAQSIAEKTLKSSLRWFPDLILYVYQRLGGLRTQMPFNVLTLNNFLAIVMKTKSDIPELTIDQAELFVTETLINLSSFVPSDLIIEVSFDLLIYVEMKKMDVNLHEYQRLLSTSLKERIERTDEFLLILIQQICSLFPNYIDPLTKISTIVLDPFKENDIQFEDFRAFPPIIKLLLGVAYYPDWQFKDKKMLYVSWASERVSKILKMSNNLSTFIKDGSPSNPVLIQTVDVERSLQKIERGSQTSDISCRFLQKSNFNKSNFDKTLKEVMEKGHWVIFYEFSLEDETIVKLLKTLERTEGSEISSTARFIIITDSEHNEQLSLVHLLSRKIIQEPPSSFKEFVSSYATSSVMENTDIFENSSKRVELMQISNLLILFFSLLNTQQCLKLRSRPVLTNETFQTAIIFSSHYLNINKEDIKMDESFLPFLIEHAFGLRDNDIVKDIVYGVLDRFINSEVLTTDSVSFKFLAATSEEQESSEIDFIQFPVLSKKINLDFVESLTSSNIATILNISRVRYQAFECARVNSNAPSSLTLFKKATCVEQGVTDRRVADAREVTSVVKELLKSIPSTVDMILIGKKYPLNINEILSNTVHAEVKMFNNQINDIRNYFDELLGMTKGFTEVSDLDQHSLVDILNGVIPLRLSRSRLLIPQFLAKLQRQFKYLQQWGQSGGLQTLILPLINQPAMFLLFMKVEVAKRKGISVSDVCLMGEFILDDKTTEKLPEYEYYVAEVSLNNASVDNTLKSLHFPKLAAQSSLLMTKLKLKAISNSSMESIADRSNLVSVPLYQQSTGSGEKVHLDTIMVPSLIPPLDLMYLDVYFTFASELN